MNRRNFLKRIGLASLLPLVPAVTKALDFTSEEIVEAPSTVDCGHITATEVLERHEAFVQEQGRAIRRIHSRFIRAQLEVVASKLNSAEITIQGSNDGENWYPWDRVPVLSEHDV